MLSRPKYLNYTTAHGVSLSGMERAGWSAFLIHESGYHPALEDWNHPGVDSPFWRFYYNPKPGCHLQHEARQIPLTPEAGVLIPPNTLFDCCAPVSACHYWLHFTVSRLAGPIPRGPVVIPLDEPLRVLIEAALRTHAAPASEARDQRLHHQSAALLHSVFAGLDLPPAPTLPEPLLAVLTLIQKAPQAQLSNGFLADRAGMPLERFIRLFRQHTGQTPAAYVIATRLRLAREALVLTDKTIDQIAVECGFPNRHYFTRMFTRQQGCGPAEFRARQHQRRGR
ncbi:Helix-turn-helix domain-containing protein [Prosthecobacter debontii]|uniref:Helix-turn-helix domain-containing protein n=1 Tax=Prosthecobacter debontii TaxID=48467 RepID=A0A1T4WIV2_9BACT|nr:AraC family transcriptional regulator [Prosthecobacter debontii]SKA76815.1 Helix-turn-helix domain-containing protein [Prosthecobacter debontii]